MHILYTVIIYLLTPFVLGRLFFLGIINPAYRARWRERFGFVPALDHAGPVIWLHAVSVGETNAASPVIEKLLAAYPAHQIVMTTVTPTGAATVKQRFHDNVRHFYFPYDLPGSVRRFLGSIKPALLMTMETEIWPNLYSECHRNKIPILILNARLSEKSFEGYRLVSMLTKRTLSMVDAIATQTPDDKHRFVALGMAKEKITVTGNLKFDVVNIAGIAERAEILKRYFSMERPKWIAASTQKGEEEIIIKAHKLVLEKYNNAVLILAPRHPERVSKVAAICERHGLQYVKRTDHIPFTRHHQVFLLDTLGELQLHYAASQLAYVGGSMVNTGGQNTMEPAGLGLPVISGPHTYNFVEMTHLLNQKQALITVYNEKELAEKICLLLGDTNYRLSLGEKARQVVEENKGNLGKLMNVIEPYLNTRCN